MLLSPYDALLERGKAAGFVAIPLADLPLRATLRTTTDGDSRTITVYLESDGAPWPFPDQPPLDPTPERPVVMDMARSDPSPFVAYLGRPCQYLEPEQLASCDPALWMRARFSEKVVRMTDRAVDALKAKSGAARVSLVGYSGGGALAALLAARRSDVACLVTIAAPLDTDAWTTSIGVSPLSESLNPLAFAGALKSMPQTHLRGLRDRLVPPETARRFLTVVGTGTARDFPAMDHSCCWHDAWVALRQQTCLADGRAGS